MPEPSDSDRRKAAQLDKELAALRLVDCLENGWDIRLRCQYCGTTKTWGRREMLGRLRARLGLTMDKIQPLAICPRCPGRMPQMQIQNGSYLDAPPFDPTTRRRRVIDMLLDARVAPDSLGYGWKAD